MTAQATRSRRPPSHMLSRIQDMDAGPLGLVAAVLGRAIEDARAGDLDALSWLTSAECSYYLDLFVPAGLDVAAIHAGLLALASKPIPPAERIA